MEWRERDGVRWLEADLGGAQAAFSTRQGGVSEPPFDSLNLGLLTEDDNDAVVENRLRLAAALGFRPEDVTFARQVHGADLSLHDAAPFACSLSADNDEKEQTKVPEADAHVLRQPGAGALVFVADCLPVALAGPEGVAMRARGLARARRRHPRRRGGGGRGDLGRNRARDRSLLLRGRRGGAGRLRRPRRRESPTGGCSTCRRWRGGCWLAAGVERVEAAGLCTSCERELFFSHRRDEGRTGSQAGLAWIEG